MFNKKDKTQQLNIGQPLQYSELKYENINLHCHLQ